MGSLVLKSVVIHQAAESGKLVKCAKCLPGDFGPHLSLCRIQTAALVMQNSMILWPATATAAAVTAAAVPEAEGKAGLVVATG